jgi:hypothetical protein
MTMELPLIASECVKNETEMMMDLEKILTGDNFQYSVPREKKIALIKPIIHNVDEKAAEKITDLILSKKSEWFGHHTYENTNKSKTYFLILKYKDKLKRNVKKMVRLKKSNVDKYYLSKFSGIKIADINDRIEALRKLDHRIPEIKVKEILDNTFSLVAK